LKDKKQEETVKNGQLNLSKLLIVCYITR